MASLTSSSSSCLLLVLALVSAQCMATPTPSSCRFCKTAVAMIIDTPYLFQEIETILDAVCNVLPVAQRPGCLKTVSKLETVWDLLHHGVEKERIFNDFTLCTMINECTVDCCVTKLMPEQVHLSYIADPHTSIGVTWVTQTNVPSIVQYTSGSTLLTATGTTGTYTKGGWNGWIHYVKIYNLTAGTNYKYRVGDGSNWSKYFSFTTETNVVPPQRVVRIANIGDMGANMSESGANMASLRTLVETKAIDFILHNGDISYADGYQGQWDQYFREMENVTANIPYMVSVGNHEVGVIGALKLAIGYIHRFQLPGEHSTTTDLSNLYYSWDYANIHFVALDTESIIDTTLFTNQQAAWLEKDLAGVDRSKTPWIIVYGHRPFYCSGDSECFRNPLVLDEAIKIMNKYKVDLVFSAHRHNYERMWPIRPDGTPVKTYVNPGAPTYILNGAGGSREGVAGFGGRTFEGSVKRIPAFGYGIFQVFNSTVLQYTFYKAGTTQVMDDVTLVVNH